MVKAARQEFSAIVSGNRLLKGLPGLRPCLNIPLQR
jgi:hypothetical protein